MKLSQKKNCNGCKGGWHEIQPFWQHCNFGYKVESKNHKGIPKEPCYKPLTNSKYIECYKIIYGR